MTSERPLHARRILVVEDQYYLATDICEWLSGAGARVVGPARDTQQACKMLKHESVDAAVVDINLGAGPSYDIAAELTERRVPFLFATGYDEVAIPPEFQQAPRLEKPFNGKALIAAVQALSSADA